MILQIYIFFFILQQFNAKYWQNFEIKWLKYYNFSTKDVRNGVSLSSTQFYNYLILKSVLFWGHQVKESYFQIHIFQKL